MTHLLTVSHLTFPEPLCGSRTWSDRTFHWTHEVSGLLEQTCVVILALSGPESGNLDHLVQFVSPFKFFLPSQPFGLVSPQTWFGSAVLQLQTGHPLVLTTALLAEAADVLQGLTLQRLHWRVLQNRKHMEHFRSCPHWGGLVVDGEQTTHRDQDAVQVPRLGPDSGVVLQQLGQPPHTGQPQDVDVIVAAERLQKREVDLQRDVIFILLICGEHAQNHAVRVSAGRGKTMGPVLVVLRVGG